MSEQTAYAMTQGGSIRRGSSHARRLNRYLQALRTPKGIVSLVLLGSLAALALLAPILLPQGYDAQSADGLAGFSGQHLFGTDELGRDVLARVAYGLRIDLALISLAVPTSAFIGTLMGLAGALSPALGNVMQRLVDVIVGFPGLIMGISIVVVIGPGFHSLFVALVVSGIAAPARLAYAAYLGQMNREYVQAAEVIGVPNRKIMLRHILPNAIDPIIVNAATYTVIAVSVSAGLSIVGLGIQPPEPSLGSILNTAMKYVYQAPGYLVGPMIILFVLAFGFSLLADALNEEVNRK